MRLGTKPDTIHVVHLSHLRNALGFTVHLDPSDLQMFRARSRKNVQAHVAAKPQILDWKMGIEQLVILPCSGSV